MTVRLVVGTFYGNISILNHSGPQAFHLFTVSVSQQDGPSLESSSYLNVTLRYLGPWDPGTLELSDPGTLGPLDLGTLEPWDLGPLTFISILKSFGMGEWNPPASFYILFF